MKTKLLFLFLLANFSLYAQTNLVPNGDFENWSSSSQPDNWIIYFDGLTSQSATAQNGASSTKMTITSGNLNFINSEYFAIQTNKTYRITLYHKVVSGTFSAIDLRIYHKPGTFKEEIIKETDATFSTTEWRKVEFEYTSTASENIEVDIWTTGDLNSEILVDNVSVVDVDDVPAQYTLIPDPNFEQKLIDLGHDDILDGKVLTNKINRVTDLIVDTYDISDLTGIEDFTALVSLNCSVWGSYSSNGGGVGKLEKLDVTNNKLLIDLTCNGNQLTSLNVSENKLLKSLDFSANLITEIDLSNNTDLTNLNCHYNRLTNLDISNNPLHYLTCSSNKLKSLDITNHTDLTVLNCANNQITSLDVSNLKLLVNLNVEKNEIDKLDIADKTNLVFLNCYSNSITSLDVSQLADLQELRCNENKLTSLDVTHNTKLTVLKCGSNTIPSLDITKNLSLIELECSSLQLGELDVTKHTELKELTSNENNLKSIDVSNNLKLTELTLYKNQLDNIDVTKNVSLIWLLISDNELTALDVSLNSNLHALVCNNNLLISLDVSNNKNLNYVLCNNNKLNYLNLKNGKNLWVDLTNGNYKNNPDLKCIQVTDAQHARQNFSQFADPHVRFSEDCGGPLELPSNNFTIETKEEMCLYENNGEINITAKESYLYTVTINGENYQFMNSTLSLTNLAPGNYSISITIPGENFEQNFNVTIAKGAAITGKSSVSSKKVNVEITEGTAPFTVFVDGAEQFQTYDSNFNVSMSTDALIEVITAKSCEGIFSKKITGLDFNGNLLAYPNPTSGSFEIEIPTSKSEIKIELYNITGQLLSQETYKIENGKAQLNLSDNAAGLYIAKINLDTPEYLKIIKN